MERAGLPLMYRYVNVSETFPCFQILHLVPGCNEVSFLNCAKVQAVVILDFCSMDFTIAGS